MRIFISHNKQDKTTARLLATALVQQGADVWFDEWVIEPGESITGGIEEGLRTANVFVLGGFKMTEASKVSKAGRSTLKKASSPQIRTIKAPFKPGTVKRSVIRKAVKEIMAEQANL